MVSEHGPWAICDDEMRVNFYLDFPDVSSQCDLTNNYLSNRENNEHLSFTILTYLAVFLQRTNEQVSLREFIDLH